MKKIMISAAVLLVLTAVLASCGGRAGGAGADASGGKDGDRITSGETEKTVRTNSKGEPIPNVLDDDPLPSSDGTIPEDESPITGISAAKKYHSEHKVLSVLGGSVKTENFTEWHDGRSGESLFDGKDGYFSSERNKMGGVVEGGPLAVEFKTSPSVVVGYAFVTGNDSSGYPERSPSEWTLYGSNDGKNWNVLDYVYDGRIAAADNEYFGYEVDENTRAEYSFYRFEFTLDTYNSPVSTFQLNECYIYADKQ